MKFVKSSPLFLLRSVCAEPLDLILESWTASWIGNQTCSLIIMMLKILKVLLISYASPKVSGVVSMFCYIMSMYKVKSDVISISSSHSIFYNRER